MRNLRTFALPGRLNVEIIVRSNDDDTFETNLCCAFSHCGKTVEIDSDGPKAVQNVSCPEHGFLASFPHQVALVEFVRCLANKILEMDGHPLIDEAATFVVGDEDSRPEWVN